MRISYRKLVRDRIPEVVAREGGQAKVRILRADQFKKELLLKLLEEAKEVRGAGSKEEVVKEIADVLEVIDALCGAHGILRGEVQRAKRKKNRDRGAFTQRLFLEYIEQV